MVAVPGCHHGVWRRGATPISLRPPLSVSLYPPSVRGGRPLVLSGWSSASHRQPGGTLAWPSSLTGRITSRRPRPGGRLSPVPVAPVSLEAVWRRGQWWTSPVISIVRRPVPVPVPAYPGWRGTPRRDLPPVIISLSVKRRWRRAPTVVSLPRVRWRPLPLPVLSASPGRRRTPPAPSSSPSPASPATVVVRYLHPKPLSCVVLPVHLLP